MKKEVLLAVLIGLVSGLIITYGVYRAQTSLSQPRNSVDTTAQPTADPQSSDNPNLSIVSPEDETVQSEESVTVAGATLPGSYVVIFINDVQSITTADSSGNFSIQTKLEAGSNIIRVHSLDENGVETVQERTVILVSSSDSSAEATSSAKTSN